MFIRAGQRAHPQANEQQYRQNTGEQTRKAEPPGLPVGGLDIERHIGFHAVPESITIAGEHSETIGARAEIVVSDLPFRDRAVPALVDAFELVLVTNAFGNGKTQRRVGEGDSSMTAGKLDILCEAGRIPASEDNSSMCTMAAAELVMAREGSTTGNAPIHGKPDFPQRIGKNGLLALDAFRPAQAVFQSVLPDIRVANGVA